MLIQDHPYFQSKNSAMPDMSEYTRKQEQINALQQPQTLDSFSNILSQSTYLDKESQMRQSSANIASGKLDIAHIPNLAPKASQSAINFTQLSELAQKQSSLGSEAKISSSPSSSAQISSAQNSNVKIVEAKEDESLIDKIKNFFGQNDDEELMVRPSAEERRITEQAAAKASENQGRGISLQREGIEILKSRPIGLRPTAISLDENSLSTLSRLSEKNKNQETKTYEMRGSMSQDIEIENKANPVHVPSVENKNNAIIEPKEKANEINALNTETQEIRENLDAKLTTEEKLLKVEVSAAKENSEQEIDKVDNHLGALSAKYESGKPGIAAIGYDRVGGTSYGKYQIASNVGTFDRFVSYLSKEAPDIADKLKAGGNANTGSRGGTMPNIWKEIAQSEPQRFEALQEGFIKHSHYDPAMSALENSKLNTDLDVLQQVVWSTSVHHGATGAKRIFDKALASLQGSENDEISAKDFISKVYDLRANQFSSSTASVRNSVQRRLISEKNDALSAFG